MSGVFFLLILGMVLSYPSAAQAVSPLYFHTHATAEIEAQVERISYVETTEVDTNRRMLRRPEAESEQHVRVMQVFLKVTKVIGLKKRDSRVPGLAEGQSVEIRNPFMDQEPPFEAGDSIRTVLRLVAPAEEFHPQDPLNQWWFLPPGEKDGSGAPRHPFEGVTVLSSHR